jgi:hypothetical protein
MRSFRCRPIVAPTLVAILLSCAVTSMARAQALFTRDLCAPGSGNIGHSWVSIPSQTDLRTPEAICQAVPGLVTVAQGINDGALPSRLWTYDCATGACSSTQPIPEPGCSASTCFCVDPGDGIDVVPAAATTMPINRCDTFTPITLVPGFKSYLYSIPYDTFLASCADLVSYIGLPSTGTQRATLSRLDCATGTLTVLTAGTPVCAATLLVRGDAYRISYYAGGVSPGYSFTNAVSCSPVPAPAAEACPIGDLTFTDSDTLTWSAPGGCPLPPAYDAIRGDLDCLRGFCSQAITPLTYSCAGCTLLEDNDMLDTAADDTTTPPVGAGYWYTARVDGGTWNPPGAGMTCTDWDFMLPPGGCP